MGRKPIVSVTDENERISIKKMYVCMHVCMYVTVFSLCIRFIKVGDSSEAARRIHRRKTAINSFQRLQSAPN